MLTKQEYHQITREILPKFFVVIPPECIIVRVKDITRILEFFTEKEKENEQRTSERIPNNPDGDSVMGQPIGNTDGDSDPPV